MAKLEILNVSKRFGDIVALERIDLTVEDNEFFCIFGPPGCGKTTMLRILLGLESPDEGEVRVGGRSVTELPAHERNLAMVFQKLALFPHMTVRENLSFPLRERRLPSAEIDATVNEIADTLQITALLKKLPAHLSGGERQRVAIGRALVRKPNAYLMDEPISALDARLRELMRVELKRLQRQFGHTLMYATHDHEEAMSIADRMCVMNAGKAAQVGSPDEIYNAPNSRYVAGLVGTPPINMLAGTFDALNQTFCCPQIGLSVNLPGATARRGGAAWLGVRPEYVRIAPRDSGIPGSICDIEPLGAFAIVAIAAGDTVLRAIVPGQPNFQRNEFVGLDFELSECHFFDGENGVRFATGAATITR